MVSIPKINNNNKHQTIIKILITPPEAPLLDLEESFLKIMLNLVETHFMFYLLSIILIL
jgi:hypothetical protein